LTASTTKRAMVRRFDRETLSGYVNPFSYLQPTGVEWLSLEGQTSTLSYLEIKAISFVRDFAAGVDGERRIFQTRPKIAGLWVNFQFRDGERMEGILPNNLLSAEPYGFTLVPPDPFSNTQKIWIPRAALKSAEVLGVVGSPIRTRRAKPVAKEQIGLFEQEG
jgi:Family of unknown function (DUF6982)